MSLKKSKCLTLHEKSLVIQELNSGQGVTHLAKKYGVAKSTICKIKKQKEIISNAVRNTFLGPGKRQTLKSSQFPRLEKILYKWFLDERNKNVILSGEMIKQKAKLIHSQISENDRPFTASEGWLQRFKKRFGIRFLKISRENLSSQPKLLDPFKIQLKNKIEELGISLEQLYNADETVLYWKLLPDETFVSAPGRKIEKQQIRFLACTNATGTHKVKPLVIGKTAKPKSFQNFECPVDYEHSKSAWMTATILKNWFHYSFVPQVKWFLKNKGLPNKALLLLDNVPSYPNEGELKSEDGQIVTMYLPPNVTLLKQPMDQNVIRLTKLFYRHSLLSTIAANNTNVTDALKKLTIKDAILNLMTAWNHLDPQIIKKCWKNILDAVPSNDDVDGDDENVPFTILKLQWDNTIENPISESLGLLHTLEPQGTFEESAVLEWNRCDNDFKDEVIEECQADEAVETNVSEPELLNKISLDSAINALNIATQWATENDVDINDLIVIKKLREKAVMQQIKNLQKQTNISD